MIIHVSPTPSIRVNDLFCGNIVDFIKSGGHFNNDQKPSAIDASTGQKYTQKQQWDLASRFATLLAQKQYGGDLSRKTRIGDVLMTVFPNCIEAAPVHWAALSLGGTVSPGSASYTIGELAHQIRVVQPKVIVCAQKSLSSAKKAVGMARANCSVLCLEEMIRLAPSTQPTESKKFPPGAAYRRIAYLAMSSGTSGGVFKAVQITHFNITSCIQVSQKSAPTRDTTDQIASAVIPVSHLYGLSKFLIMSPYVGSTTVFHQRFDINEFLEAQRTYNINSWPLVPPIVVLLTKHPLTQKYLPSLKQHMRLVCCGAAPLGVKATEDFLQAVSGDKEGKIRQADGSIDHVRVIQGWGLTETSPTCTTFDPADPNAHIRSCGSLVANTEIRVRGQGQDLPAATFDIENIDAALKKGNLPIGEIYVRGPQVTCGYHKNPEADVEAFEQCYDPHVPWFHLRWFRTGDVGFIDRKGRLAIVDRTKEMIKSMGKQVAPAELEDLLLSHPEVEDAAVIGIENSSKGTESARAFLVLRNSTYDASQVRQWLDGQVPSYKQLHAGIVVIDKVPKNASGKILRRLLRARNGDRVVGLDKAML